MCLLCWLLWNETQHDQPKHSQQRPDHHRTAFNNNWWCGCCCCCCCCAVAVGDFFIKKNLTVAVCVVYNFSTIYSPSVRMDRDQERETDWMSKWEANALQQHNKNINVYALYWYNGLKQFRVCYGWCGRMRTHTTHYTDTHTHTHK